MRYDQLNRLKEVESLNVASAVLDSHDYLYSDLNQRTRHTRADGSYWSYGYDDLGQVDSAVRYNGSDVAIPGYGFGYTFDEIGNRTQTTTNGRTASYTPNNLNQYDERQVPRALDIRGTAVSGSSLTVNGNAATRQNEVFHHALDLSSGGNSAQQVDILVTASLPDGGDNNAPRIADAEKSEYLSATPEVFDHDDDGNLTLDGKWTYTWDAENRLIEMETLPAAVTAGAEQLKLEFGYDSQGRRFSKKVYEWDGSAYQLNEDTQFLWDGWNLVYSLTDLQNGSQTEKAYVWGNDLSGSMQGAGGVGGLLMAVHAQTGIYYPSFDGNGNVMAYISADTGESVAQYAYSAFGELIQETGSQRDEFDIRFSTKPLDVETGLISYQLRYYNPSTGKWLSIDPIEEEGGLNLYAAMGNDPISLYDILGLITIQEICSDLRAQMDTAASKLREAEIQYAVADKQWKSVHSSSDDPVSLVSSLVSARNLTLQSLEEGYSGSTTALNRLQAVSYAFSYFDFAIKSYQGVKEKDNGAIAVAAGELAGSVTIARLASSGSKVAKVGGGFLIVAGATISLTEYTALNIIEMKAAAGRPRKISSVNWSNQAESA